MQCSYKTVVKEQITIGKTIEGWLVFFKYRTVHIFQEWSTGWVDTIQLQNIPFITPSKGR